LIRISSIYVTLIDENDDIMIPKEFYFENLSEHNILDMLNKLRYWNITTILYLVNLLFNKFAK